MASIAEEISFPAPVGLRIATGCGHRLLRSAVGKHGPDLLGAGAGGLKYNVTSVRRPAGKIVTSSVMRQLHPLLAGNVDQINVLCPGCARAVMTNPGERQKLPIWRP